MVRMRSRLSLGGTRVDVWEQPDVLTEVGRRLQEHTGTPLFLASANLDHISHFGRRGCSRGQVDFEDPAVHWLVLLDGVPLVWRSRRILDGPVEQLAGSDLLPDVLDVASRTSARVGIFGGAPSTHEVLRAVLAETHPGLLLADCWAPTREDLTDAARCRDLAEKVAAADIHLLVVALGKPRQERFLADYGLLTGARVAVAFGAAIDFLAGDVQRAPERVRHAGLEWLWRLVQEPRRLAHRYLVAGPPGALSLWRDSRVLTAQTVEEPLGVVAADAVPEQRREGVPWDGRDSRTDERRRTGASTSSASWSGIPEQRQFERRERDRRVGVMART